jgi:hypothetical protein
MAHDVFISYSSKDKPVADATCATLEARGIRCWMAPRDIMPGADWGESIIDAINSSRAFVLVFSANANVSVQIKREVERAINKGLPVIPLRIENVLPVKSLEFFLSTPHWLDAFSPPLEKHLNYLADVIGSVLDGKPQPKPPPPKPHKAMDRRLLLGGVAAAVILLALGGWWLKQALTPPSFVGDWVTESVQTDTGMPNPFGNYSVSSFVATIIQARKLSGTLHVTDLGRYNSDGGGDDAGTVTMTGPGTVNFTSDLTHRTSVFTYYVLHGAAAAPAALALGGQSGDSALGLNRPGASLSMLAGAPGATGLTGHWTTHTSASGILGAVTTSLDVTANGHYHYHFDIAEAGAWQAANGKWTTTPENAAARTSNYKFDGSDRVTLASDIGTWIWKRAP